MTLERDTRKGYRDENSSRYFIRQRRLKRRRFEPVSQYQQSFWPTKESVNREMIPSLTPVEVRVRCCGKLHRCSVTLCGRIRFHDHARKELHALRVLRSLGDTTCGCLDLPDRLRKSEKWRGDKQVFVRTIQRTVELRGKLSRLHHRPSIAEKREPGAISTERTPAYRRALIASRVVASLQYFFKSAVRESAYGGISKINIGIADTRNPPGIFMSDGRTYNVNEGWKPADVEALCIVPLDFILRIVDKTGAIEKLVCFAWQWTGEHAAQVRVAVRKSIHEFVLEWHDVQRDPKTGVWTFVTPIHDWRPK